MNDNPQTQQAVSPAFLILFHKELRQRNQRILLWSGWVFNIIYLAWSAFDYYLAPNHWREFLTFRLVAVALNTITVIAVRSKKLRSYTWEAFWAWLCVFGVFIAPMLPRVGTSFSPYVMGFTLIILGAGVLPFWPLSWASSNICVVILSVPAAFLIWPSNVNPHDLFTSAFFIATATGFSLVATYFRYHLLLREYRSREALEHTSSALSDALGALKQLDQLKSHFFANVSHELRTPLTLSLGPLEAILLEESGSKHVEQLSMVWRNQLRLLRLINNLLDFSKLEAGKIDVCFRQTDLKRQLNALVDVVKTASDVKNVALEMTVPQAHLEAYIDREKFDKIVLNLLSNALKFTDPGGAIFVSLGMDNSNALLEVSDTGIGIPTNKQSIVFDRFAQVDASITRKYSGTGIGLAMVKEYVELHGGSVKVESAEGEGATFVVTFPLGKDHLDPAAIDDSTEPELPGVSRELSFDVEPTQANPTPSGQADMSGHRHSVEPRFVAPNLTFGPPGPVRVLVVDDVPDMQVYIGGILEHEYEIITANNGEEGLRLAETMTPSLVISDVMMPRMSGEELCSEIRSLSGALRHVPILLVTARADTQHKLHSLGAGADDYLFKPFSPPELRARARNLVRKYQYHLALESAHKSLALDLGSAGRFQQLSLSPIPKLPWVAMTSVFEPMDAAGGDFYDVWIRSENQVRVLFGDVVGHGVQGALRAAVIGREYERIKKTAATPAEVLNTLHRVFLDRYPKILASGARRGCDLSCEVICADIVYGDGSISVRVSSASAARPVHVRDGNTHEVPVSALALGRLAFTKYDELDFQLSRGDRLYFYTDGITEQRRPDGESFGPRRLQNTLGRVHNTRGLEDCVGELMREWDDFRGEIPRGDDVALLAVECVA